MLANAVANDQIIFEKEDEDVTCQAPNGSPGHCLLYTQCANLTNWSIQNNIQTMDDLKKMFCQNDVSRLLSPCNSMHSVGINRRSQVTTDSERLTIFFKILKKNHLRRLQMKNVINILKFVAE